MVIPTEPEKKFIASVGTFHAACFVYCKGTTIYSDESAAGSNDAQWELDWRTDEYRLGPGNYSENNKNRVITQGFSWGQINYSSGGSTKTMFFPSASNVGISAINAATTNAQLIYADDDDGTPTIDQDVEKVNTALIYTVCSDSFVLVYVKSDISGQPDSVDICFRPGPDSRYDELWAAHKNASDRSNYLYCRKYPRQFNGWIHIGATNENWSGGGDNVWSIALPCKAGAKFAFFRSIFAYSSNLKVTKNSSGVVTGVVSNGMDKIFPGPTDRDNYLNGNDYAEGKLIIPFNLKLSSLQSKGYGWNTATSTPRPANGCIQIHEMPMYA